MLRYALPLIPANIFWWITHVSDRYMVTYMIDESANGMYALAYKIPTMISIVSTIFIEAWQLSAVVEKNDPKLPKFFTDVFSSYQSLLFFGGSGCIMLCKVMIYLLSTGKPSFYIAWKYVPILVMATCFSCFVTFLGSVYVVEKKSFISFLTTFLGAVSNVALNFLMVPKLGVNGAALATMFAYIIVYVIRAISTKRLIPMQFKAGKTLLNILLLGGQAAVMIYEIPGCYFISAGIFLVVTVVNLRGLFHTVFHLLQKRKRS